MTSLRKSRADKACLINYQGINHYLPSATAKGLPIGNLTSQFFANIYLKRADQFVKHELKAKYYLRYVDDFVILEKERAQLEFLPSRLSQSFVIKSLVDCTPRQIISPADCWRNWFCGVCHNDPDMSWSGTSCRAWRAQNGLDRWKNYANKRLRHICHMLVGQTVMAWERKSGKINMNGYNKPESSIDTGLLIKRSTSLKWQEDLDGVFWDSVAWENALRAKNRLRQVPNIIKADRRPQLAFGVSLPSSFWSVQRMTGPLRWIHQKTTQRLP